MEGFQPAWIGSRVGLDGWLRGRERASSAVESSFEYRSIGALGDRRHSFFCFLFAVFFFVVRLGSVPVFWLTANLIHFRFDSLHPPPYLPHLHAYYKFFKYLSGAALVRVVAAAGPTMSSDCYRCHCCCWWLWLFHCNLFDFHCIKFFAPARCLPLFSWCVAIICWLSAAPALLRF